MLKWLKSQDKNTPLLTLGVRALDSRNLQILKTTMAVLRLPEQWQLDPKADEGVVIVDIDEREGRQAWRRLVESGRFYRVIPLSANRKMVHVGRGLLKPLRAGQLEELLREIGHELTTDKPPERTTVPLLCEAIQTGANERFTVQLPSGDWYYIERDQDRVYGHGGIERLTDMLFKPIHQMAIKPLALRPESLAGGTVHDEYSLCLLLWSAAQRLPLAEMPPQLLLAARYRLSGQVPWKKLPHQPEQRALADYLQSAGDADLIGLVLETGLEIERVLHFILGTWLLGCLTLIRRSSGAGA